MCSGVVIAPSTSVGLYAWSWGWALCSTAAFASPVITGRKSRELMPLLNVVLTSACPGSKTAPTNRPCNRLSHTLPSAVSCSSRKIFPAPVANQAVGDLSELWSYGIYHSSISACPALPASIHFCLDAAEEEWDLLLSRLGGEPQSHPNETIRLWAGLHFCSCSCRNINWAVSCCGCRKPQKQFAVLSASQPLV